MESSPESRQDLPKVLYAKSDSVKVTKEKDPTSEVVQVLNRGEAVKVVEKSGSRYQVKLTKGKKGWVPKLRLTERKPRRNLKVWPIWPNLKLKNRPQSSSQDPVGVSEDNKPSILGSFYQFHFPEVATN